MQPSSLLRKIYRDSLSLSTDLYELTMAYAYWKNGLTDQEAVFQLFFRKYPFNGAYAICAGIDVAIDYLENFHFDANDLAYLENLETPLGKPLFERAFLDYLANLEIVLDVDAMEEGTPAFPYEPLIRVKGPILQAQLMESTLLNLINFQTLIATKASRVCHAAKGDPVVEFGLRRAQGIDGAISASRAAFIGGCHYSSHVLAGKLFGIPVLGTHAHSWVMSFEEEKEAFYQYARVFPNHCVFLIDTYDTIRGVERAIEVAKDLRKEGIEMLGVRLDSGDLNRLSRRVRAILDEAGFRKTQIMATNELTEEIISDLKHQGAAISMWGVGTNLVTGKEQPALDGVYKMSAIRTPPGKWQNRLKISEQVIKTTNPGIGQVRRFKGIGGYVADMLYDEEKGASDLIIHHTEPVRKKRVRPEWEYKDLLVPMLRGGKRIYLAPPIEAMRQHASDELSLFDPSMRRFLYPEPFFAGIEERLFLEKVHMIEGMGRE